MNAFFSSCVPCALLALSAVAGCSSSDGPIAEKTGSSDSFKTSDLQASYSVQDNGTSTTVYAALINSTDFIPLGVGDSFVAEVGTQTATLQEVTGDLSIHYEATFASVASSTSSTIAFDRQNGQTSAPSSAVTVPAPFSLVSPPTSVVGYGTPIQIPIDGPTDGGSWKVSATGECLGDGGQTKFIVPSANVTSTTTASLVLSFEAADIVTKVPSCALLIHVQHVIEGAIDPSFSHAALSATDFEGIQDRQLMVTIQGT